MTRSGKDCVGRGPWLHTMTTVRDDSLLNHGIICRTSPSPAIPPRLSRPAQAIVHGQFHYRSHPGQGPHLAQLRLPSERSCPGMKARQCRLLPLPKPLFHSLVIFVRWMFLFSRKLPLRPLVTESQSLSLSASMPQVRSGSPSLLVSILPALSELLLPQPDPNWIPGD